MFVHLVISPHMLAQSEWVPLVEKMNSVKAQYQDLTGLSLDPKKKQKKKTPQPAKVHCPEMGFPEYIYHQYQSA